MSQYFSRIEQDWDELAIDDESFLLEKNSYRVRIESRDEDVIFSEVDSIRYNPEINSAPSVTLDVEPKEELTQEEFIAGHIDVFVDGDILFAGKIVTIDYSQRDEDWYSITAYSPFRELEGVVLDEEVNNDSVSDFIAKTVDDMNEVDEKLENLVNTGQESVDSSVTKQGNVRIGPGTVSYDDVGDDASEIESIFVKAHSLDTFTFQILVGTTPIVISIDDSLNKYGDWYELDLTDETLPEDPYSLVFPLEEDTDALMDWIVITDSDFDRIVEPSEVSVVEEDKVVADVSSEEDFEEFFDSEETEPYFISEDGELKLAQTCFLREGEPGTNTVEDDAYSGGEAASLIREGQSTSILSFEPEYTIEEENVQIWARGRNVERGLNIQARLNGDVVGDNTLSANLDWYEIFYTGPDLQRGESYVLELEAVEFGSSPFRTDIDVFCILDSRYDYTFDNSIFAGDFINGPQLYPDEYFVEGSSVEASKNISNFSFEATISDTTGEQRIQCSTDEGVTWIPSDGSEENTNVVEFESRQPSVTIAPGFTLHRHGFRNDDSPKFGFEGAIIDDFEIKVDLDDFSVIDTETVSDNALSAISSFADNSNVIFRTEGNTIRIFRRGTRKTDVDVRKEEVTSSIDIEDSYDSVEVIGRDGISSGVIEAVDSPDYVDKHIEINDRDVENVQAAIRRAVEFLDKNSSVEYSGRITTLPTRIPVGEEIDGSNFSHGQDSIIKSGSYSKNRTDIETGKIKDIGLEVLNLNRQAKSSQKFDVRQ